MPRRWREPAAIAAEINRIRSLRLDALRREWRLVFGRVPPAGLSKDLLGRMVATRLQERAFGGLDRDSLRFLESLARHECPPRRQLKPGTVLVREYRGRRHIVTTRGGSGQTCGPEGGATLLAARLTCDLDRALV